jgi:HEPN domain-containing protein
MKKTEVKIAQEWFAKADHDFENAKIILKNHGYYDTIAFLFQQTIEKYLKGYLLYHGWTLKKIHDLEELLTEAIKIDKDFQKFLPDCQRITQYYIESRYPLEPPVEYSAKEIKDSLEVTERIIKKIKAEVR